MKRIAIITSTRAEYGLLTPVIREFRRRENNEFRLDLIVTGTHLSENYGKTINEIQNDGFRIDYKVKVDVNSESVVDISNNMADTLIKFTKLFENEKFTAIILLGDRYEIFCIAIAATNCHIPIFHLCGGDTTEGAIDECLRHSITKMSYLHFVTNEQSKYRVIQLGENPTRVFNVGSTSIDNIIGENLMCKSEVLKSINMNLCDFALCTFHPVTLENASEEEQIYEFLEAIKEHSELQFIVTKSNSDLGGAKINAILDQQGNSIKNMHVFSSLGMKRYLSLMKYAEFIIGNSSSGILEAPSFHLPTINIGDRQKGRLQCDSIINCEPLCSAINDSIKKAMSYEMKEICRKVRSPYGDGNASIKIVDKCMMFIKENINLKKKFYDVRQEE